MRKKSNLLLQQLAVKFGELKSLIYKVIPTSSVLEIKLCKN